MPLLVRCVRFVFGVFTVVRPSARSVFNFNRGIHKRSLGDCCSVAVPTGRERRELTCNACSFATIPGLIKPGPKASCSGQILYISACCASLQSFVAQCLQSHGGHPERLLGNGENEAVPNVPVVKTCFTVGVEGCAMFLLSLCPHCLFWAVPKDACVLGTKHFVCTQYWGRALNMLKCLTLRIFTVQLVSVGLF